MENRKQDEETVVSHLILFQLPSCQEKGLIELKALKALVSDVLSLSGISVLRLQLKAYRAFTLLVGTFAA